MRGHSVGPEEIRAARRAIAGALRPTPCIRSESLTALCGVPVHLKPEHQQITGSFKLRGATHAISRLTAAQRERGVVCASTGNHGRALAHAARQAGLRCTVCMSALVPPNKVEAIRALGAEIRIAGQSQDDAQDAADRLVAGDGMVMLPPFDHPDIIAGQGTLGLELLDEVPELGTVLVQLSGGGLIAGVAAALKGMRPDISVIGLSMERGAAMYAALAAGRPVAVRELPTLADSLGGGIGLENRHSFAMVRDLVDEVVLLTEAEIARGVRYAYWQERQIVEGAGAVGIAALIAGKVRPTGVTAVLLSGGNIDMGLHHRLISGEDVDLAKG